MSFHCKACRIAVPLDGKGACSICGGAVRAVRAPSTKPSVLLSKLPGAGWRAKYTDGDGIIYIGRGLSPAEAMHTLFVDIVPTEKAPLEIRIVDETEEK